MTKLIFLCALLGLAGCSSHVRISGAAAMHKYFMTARISGYHVECRVVDRQRHIYDCEKWLE